MATIKVSALTALPVADATYTYGITDAGTEGKVPIGGANGLAGLASPALTGTPTAPTAADATNSTQLATTAFVFNNAALFASQSLSYFVATNGGNYGIVAGAVPYAAVVAAPAATIAGYTLTIADGTLAGAHVFISTKNTITALTLSGTNWSTAGLTLPTTLLANTGFGVVWDDGTATGSPGWVRFQ